MKVYRVTWVAINDKSSVTHNRLFSTPFLAGAFVKKLNEAYLLIGLDSRAIMTELTVEDSL